MKEKGIHNKTTCISVYKCSLSEQTEQGSLRLAPLFDTYLHTATTNTVYKHAELYFNAIDGVAIENVIFPRE